MAADAEPKNKTVVVSESTLNRLKENAEWGKPLGDVIDDALNALDRENRRTHRGSKTS